MLPEIGATELMVIAAVALIVVGPKDLPVLLRKLGQFVARLRGMANEFRSSFDEMARQSELDELRKEVAAMRSGSVTSLMKLDDPQISRVFDDINADLTGQPGGPPVIADDYAPEPEPAPTPTKRVRKAPAKAAAVEPAPAPKTAAVKKAPAKPKAPSSKAPSSKAKKA